MQDLSIRPMRRADLDDLRTMITALAAFHGDTAMLDLDCLNRDIFGAQPWIHISVACVGDQLVGYYGLCPLIKLQYCSRGMDMHHLYVDPGFRGTGVGRALIAHAVAYAQALGCRYVMVGTVPGNVAAQDVYLACGFVRTDHDKDRFVRQIS